MIRRYVQKVLFNSVGPVFCNTILFLSHLQTYVFSEQHVFDASLRRFFFSNEMNIHKYFQYFCIVHSPDLLNRRDFYYIQYWCCHERPSRQHTENRSFWLCGWFNVFLKKRDYKKTGLSIFFETSYCLFGCTWHIYANFQRNPIDGFRFPVLYPLPLIINFCVQSDLRSLDSRLECFLRSY